MYSLSLSFSHSHTHRHRDATVLSLLSFSLWQKNRGSKPRTQVPISSQSGSFPRRKIKNNEWVWFSFFQGEMYSAIHSLPLDVQGSLDGTNLPGDACLVLTSDPKPRLRWTAELHERFVDAVTQLGGPDSAYTLLLLL